jgi:ABC-type polysaccharide/polyol phosphate export permease
LSESLQLDEVLSAFRPMRRDFHSSPLPDEWRSVSNFNPTASVIEGFRLMLTGRVPFPNSVLYVSVARVCLLIYGYRVFFNRIEVPIADRS